VNATTASEGAAAVDSDLINNNTRQSHEQNNGDSSEAAASAEEAMEEGNATVDAFGDVSEHPTGYLVLRTAKRDTGGVRQVPNCCAVCLSSYEVGDRVVWSSNEECKHVFHYGTYKIYWITPCMDLILYAMEVLILLVTHQLFVKMPCNHLILCKDCAMEWLVKMKDGTPCPCCRQDFTDLEEHRKERKIKWAPGSTFNIRSIGL
jgi:hypothetical protein